jgi:hypothetical protein
MVGALTGFGLYVQLVLRPPPDVAQKLEAERALAERREREREALEERWSHYSERRTKDEER